MRSRLLCVIAFALLSAGCPKRLVIPDPNVPHQLAKGADLTVWCGTPDRKAARCKVRVEEGWWVASPQAVEKP